MTNDSTDSRDHTDDMPEALADPARLAELTDSGLLDSPSEAAFDRLTQLASEVIQTPVSLLSLVDDRRQFFKSAIGLGEPWASRRETPLSHSFCQHAVVSGKPLIVADAREHPQLCDNLAIVELEVIAFLGIPLTTASGRTLGTLCVVDHRRRDWTEAEIRILTELTALVMTEIELRQQLRRVGALEGRSQAEVARLNLLLDSTAEAIYSMDTDGRCTFCNRACVQLLGYRTAEELIGRRMHDLIHHTRVDGSPYPIDECRIYRAFTRGHRTHVEDEVLWRADGSSFPAEYWSYPIVEQGRILGAVVTFVDVSQRRAAERLLRESETRYRETFENAAVGMAHVALDGRWLRVNDRLCQILDYRRDELLSLNSRDLTHGDDRAREAARLQALLAGEDKVYSLEKRFIRRDGTEVWTNQTVSLMRDEDGRAQHLIAIIQDVSEQKSVERALVAAKQSADAANRSKSEFLANMSHEIRTPMTAILGYADVLASRLADVDDVRCVETIKRNGAYLLHIINDILDLSKVEAGKLEIEIGPVPLPQLLADVDTLMSVRAEEKAVAFSLEYSTPVPETVYSDPTRLRQILINVVGNAIKFTDSGTVRLEVGYDHQATPPILRFDIIDTGIGMTAAQLESAFRPFTQGDSSVTRRYGGTGLGLPISKKLVESLDGDIEITSEPDQGTTVSVRLRINAASDALITPATGEQPAPPPPSSVPAPQPQLLAGRILVVEDQRDTRQLLTRQLTQAGAEVSVAVNGRDAVDQVAQQPFDAVVMDMQMPVLDGYRAARALRERGFERPIIALTAAAMRGDREKCVAAGCNDYLTKPVDAAAHISLLAKWLAAQPPAAVPAAAGVHRVLLVDDNRDACQAMVELLKILGYQVRAAHDGHNAVEQAAVYRPDAVLLDIGLPDIDGYEVAARLRRIDGLEQVVLIAVTGFARDVDRERAAGSGFTGHLCKPVDLAALKAQLEASGVPPARDAPAVGK